MKTLVGINNLTMMDQLAYANHLQFWYRLGKEHPQDNFILCNPRRMSIDNMRNFCAKAAMEMECDYLMFIDDDVLVPFDCYTKMKKHDKDIVAGVTLIRGYPFEPMIFNFANKGCHFYQDYKENVVDGLVECDAIGFSCVLIKVSVLKEVRPPYFITGPTHTEDVYFCRKAKEQLPDLKIYVDPTIETAHILGSDILTPENVKYWKTFEESRNPMFAQQKKDNKEREDRAIEYLKQIGVEVVANET